MKQVMRTILQVRPNRWGTISLILFITGWTLGLNPGHALAELSTGSFDQGVFMSVSPIGTPTDTPPPTNTPEPTNTPSPTNTPEPSDTAQPNPDTITLAFKGPGEVSPGQIFNVSVEAQNVITPGLYGVQFEIDFDPALFSVSDLQVNADLAVVIINSVDNASGKIRLAAARQGAVPGLLGEVPLLTFTVTAANTPGSGSFTMTGQKIGSPQAVSLNTTTQAYMVSIQGTSPEPTPIPSGTPSPEPSPTSSATPPQTPMPTDTPAPTDTPIPGPTETPAPTDTPIPGPTETPAPTDTPTPGPTETPQPGTATVSGQIILTGRINNDWSGASARVDDSEQITTTDTLGRFSLTNVTAGAHSSITADAPGYLPAVCTAPTLTAPETTLTKIALLSGDVSDDGQVNITDGTTIGVFFGNTGPDLQADINRDQQVDILDLILVMINFGQGPQMWNCLE